MKTIENKTTTIQKPDGLCSYADLIETIINQKVQGGYSISDITMRLKIDDKIKNANGVIELEDAEFTYLKKLVNESKWNGLHEDILKFHEDINSLK